MPYASGQPGCAAVAAGSVGTADAAASVLADGGNAVDAVLAAGFAAPVAEPGLSSLAGGGFLMVHTPDGETWISDFFTNTPAAPPGSGAPLVPITVRFLGADQVFHVGPASVAVPGCLAGYLHAHEAWGAIPLASVVGPAQQLADVGAVMDAAQEHVFTLIGDILTSTDEGAALFGGGGRYPVAGDRLRNPAYASFLGDLAASPARGVDRFRFAAVETVTAGGGLLTVADQQRYRVVLRRPLVASRSGASLLTNPPPSLGGSIITSAIGLLGPGSVDTSDGLANQVSAIRTATEQHRTQRRMSVRGTTHVSVVDSAGMIAAMTTSNGSGSGQYAAGLGVQLNNMLGEEDLHPGGLHTATPSSRIASMMAPSLLRAADGSLVGFGSGGSERIRSALLAMTVNLTDRGMSLPEAIAAARAHPTNGVVNVEPGATDEQLSALAALGEVRVWQERNLYFGGVHAVQRHPDGAVTAAADPRRGGVVRIVE